MITPCGYKILVKYQKPTEVTEWGFELAVDSKTKRLEKAAVDQGTIVSVGPNAWKAYDDGSPWAKVGDVVYYSRYGGMFVTDPEDGEEYVLLNDQDINCIIHTK